MAVVKAGDAKTFVPTKGESNVRTLFLHTIVSLDGFIEGPHGELDWQFIDTEFEEYTNDMLRSIDAMLYGRVSYQLLAEYWPTAVEHPAAAADPSRPETHIETARLMNALPKYVISSTLQTTHWDNSHIISEDVPEQIEQLKNQPGKDIALFAGARLTASLMEHDLIDEYRLVINPVLLGSGTPLFNDGHEEADLTLLDVKRFNSGALVLRYAP